MLYIILDSIGVLIGIGLFLFFSGLSILPDDITGSAILGIIGLVIGNLIIWTSIPGIIGGIGLLKRKNWARILVLVLGFLNLIDIPVGTALGIYTLWVLFKEDTARLFPATAA